MPSFPHHYQTELAYYRDLALEYAHRFPEVAHIVAERGSDPSTERALQGAALLTARLRYRVDDDFPEIAQALFRLMWPQHVRPLPAVTLLQMSPRQDALRQTQTLPAGTLVGARPLEAADEMVECSFRTCATIDVPPLELTRAEVNRAHPADLQLQLAFSTVGGATCRNMRIDRLRLQFRGPPATRYTLYLWLTQHLEALSVCAPDGEERLRLPASSVQPIGFDAAEALCPHTVAPLPGLRLLREYFCFEEKFIGVQLEGLQGIDQAEIDDEFTLVFHLGRPPYDTLRVTGSDIQLGCVPAVNISERQTLQVPVAEGTSVFRLAPQLPHQQIFAAHSVGGHDVESGEWIAYQPFFEPGRSRLTSTAPCFQLLRRGDGVEGTSSYVIITDNEGRPLAPRAKSLHVEASVTDGDLPLKLGIGDVDRPTASSPEFVKFHNIEPLTPPERAAVGDDHHWKLLALFTMHPHDLFSVNGITRLMSMARGTRDVRLPDIRRVTSSLGGVLHRRTLVPMRQILVEVEEASFEHEGQLALFGFLLRSLLARPSGSRVFNRLAVRAEPSGRTFDFDPV